jgi:glutathione peroxidase
VTDILDIPLKTITGNDSTLGDYRGKVLLVVNVASKCGLTKQYTALETLYEDYRDKGLVVLGFPANDFGAQEPGTEAEIQEFCTTNFGVKFPMFSKIAVTGSGRHPLYDELTAAQPTAASTPGSDFKDRLKGHGITPASGSDVLWNFEKFLVGRDGKVIARFAPDVTPDDPMIITAIEAALAKAA